jgi:hypothetical protein
MFCYDVLSGKNPDAIILEIENTDAFLPLVEALFPNKEFKWVDEKGPFRVQVY